MLSTTSTNNGSDKSTELAIVSSAKAAEVQQVDESVDIAALKAQRVWQRVGQRMRRITPSGVAHGVLLAIAFVLITWLVLVCWVAFLPFEIGIVLAYVTLPVVNSLSKRMPRRTAAFVMMLAEIGLVLAFFGFLVPIVIQELFRTVQNLPSGDELRAFFSGLKAQVQSLPDPIPTLVGDWSQQTAQDLRTKAGPLVGQFLGIVASSVLGILGTVTFALGLLVIPTWLTAVLRDQPKGVRLLWNSVPSGVRADARAIIRIIDQTLRVYLRGLLVSGFLVGLLCYCGLSLLDALGFEGINYRIILSMLAGFAMLIPVFGPVIGIVPAVLITYTYSGETAAAVLLMYLGIYILVGMLLKPRLQGKSVDLHPAILAMVLVAGSQFGLLGVILAAPLTIIGRDLFRYIYGRTSDSPRPAGILPGERVRPAATLNKRQVAPSVKARTTQSSLQPVQARIRRYPEGPR